MSLEWGREDWLPGPRRVNLYVLLKRESSAGLPACCALPKGQGRGPVRLTAISFYPSPVCPSLHPALLTSFPFSIHPLPAVIHLCFFPPPHFIHSFFPCSIYSSESPSTPSLALSLLLSPPHPSLIFIFSLPPYSDHVFLEKAREEMGRSPLRPGHLRSVESSLGSEPGPGMALVE